MKGERVKAILWFGVLPLSILMLLHFVGASFFYLIFFATAFYWNMALTSEEEKRKAETRKYRFSFLRVAYGLHGLISIPCEKFPGWLVRSLSPLFFALAAMLLSPSWHPIFCLLGSGLFEGIKLFRERHLEVPV